MINKKAFSFVEILIVVSILGLLTIMWIASRNWYVENRDNAKVISDTQTITSALESFSTETQSLPMPGWNINFFAKDTSYIHSYDDSETFWVYGSLTETTLAKRYLDSLPLDPRTNSYYSYGKTKDTNEFEIASIQVNDYEPIAMVVWNYTAETGPYNLIREYNWPNFVYDWSKTNLPYNPDELLLIATDSDWNIYKQWDTISTQAWETKEIFFSDGSVSVIQENSSLTLNELDFKWENNLNTVVKLGLQAGRIWTKATSLNDNSEFEIYTSDTAAAVRWTIFWVFDNSTVVLIEWKIDVFEANSNGIADITNKETIEVLKWEAHKVYKKSNWWTTPVSEDDDIDVPEDFSHNNDIRQEETVAMITEENNEDEEENENEEKNENEEDNENENDTNQEEESNEENLEDEHIEDIEEIEIVEEELTTDCFTGIKVNDKCYESNIPWYKIVWVAPYDEPWNLNMYDKNLNPYWINSWRILDNTYPLPDSCNNSSDIKSSFCVMWQQKWVYIDNSQNDDFIEYSELNLNDDFIIEMNVLVPNSDSPHYLLYGWNNFKLLIENWKLKFKKWSSNWTREQNLTKLNFNQIYIKKENNNIYLKVGSLTTQWKKQELKLENNINELIVWAAPLSKLYISQINSIIDYIKIYKK